MKKVAITGAAGLIGKEAVRAALGRGFDVCALSRQDRASEDGARWIKCDLHDERSVRGVFESERPEYLLHLAWDTTPKTYLEGDSNFKSLIAGQHLLRAFAENGGKRAVYAGTCLEYAPSASPLDEFSSEICPESTYGKCKDFLNRISALQAGKSGISFGWGRIFYVFGKNEHKGRLLPYVIDCALKDEPIAINSGNLVKDYMYAADIGSAFAAFLDSAVEGNVNICTGSPITVKDFVAGVLEKLGKSGLATYGNAPADKSLPVLGCSRRLNDEVGFSPEYSLSAALDEILVEYV